jgi:hypothetical protein
MAKAYLKANLEAGREKRSKRSIEKDKRSEKCGIHNRIA